MSDPGSEAERVTPAAGGAGEQAGGWRALDARVLALHVARLAATLGPVAIVLLLGRELDPGVTITVALLFGGRALAVAADALRWRTTRYRIGDERVELRSGLLRRSDRSVPRDRIRTVNVTAKPLHRVFGLATVDIGTGRHGGSGERDGLVLDAVATGEADRLRRGLLARPATAVPLAGSAGAAVPAPAAAPPSAGGTDRPAAAPSGTAAPRAAAEDDPLARLRWGWLPYDLLSPWTLALPLLVVGGGIQLLDSLGVEAAALDAASNGADTVRTLPLVLAVLLLAAGVLVVGIAAAGALFVESWWGFALVREPGGTLRVRRGLLTSRSISIEQRRLRGVELAEPLLLRGARGATLHAIASGLRSDDDGSGGKGARTNALLPSVPRRDAEDVAARVLQEPDAPVGGRRLRPHPRAALRRRLVRASAAVVAIAAVLAVAGPLLGWLPGWTPALALAAIGPALLLGRDAHRALGHGLAGRYLLARHGTFVRRTYALQRDGVIGWTVSRSPFQRRAGVLTLTATTAAGRGGYRIIDVADREALAFAEEAVPGILAPFLDRSSATTTPSAP